MKKRSLGINAFLNSFRSILNLLFPLITFPYISRVLSVNGVGIYNFANTYVSYFLLIAGLGIATYAVREGAKYRGNKEKISIFSSQVFTINVYSTVIAYVLLLASLMIFGNLRNYVSSILIFSLQIIFTTIGTEWIYIIYEDYSYITIRNIAFKILSIFLLFLLVKTPNDYLQYAAIIVFANVGSNILNFIHVKQFCTIKLVKNTNWKYHLRPILIIFASSVAVTIYVSSDTTILGLLKDSYDVGIYSTSVRIYQMAQGVLSAILTVTIPRLAMLWGQQRLKEYKNVLSKVINTLEILVLPASVGLMMLSKEVVLIIAGKKYLNSVNSLRIITWAIIFSIFAWIFSDCVLIPAKRESKVLRNTVITGIVNIILNFILIPFWSYDGTSLSTLIAEGMVMILNGITCWDIIKDIILSKDVFYNLITSIVGCIGIVIICILCKISYSNMIIEMIMSVILSVIIYGAILVLLRNKVILNVINNLKFRLRKK